MSDMGQSCTIAQRCSNSHNNYTIHYTILPTFGVERVLNEQVGGVNAVYGGLNLVVSVDRGHVPVHFVLQDSVLYSRWGAVP